MTTGWLIVNIALVAVVAAIVAVPAVFIPMLLDRDTRVTVQQPAARRARQQAPNRGWTTEAQRADAA